MTVSSTSQKAIANLGWEEIKLPNPVFVGDTLYAETEVLGKRESKSRPGAGIVRVRHSGKNQNGDYVMHMVRSFLTAKRGQSVVDAVRDRMP
jgi:itaconyl-CoA hydratase